MDDLSPAVSPSFSPYDPFPWLHGRLIHGLDTSRGSLAQCIETFLAAQPNPRALSIALVGDGGSAVDTLEALREGPFAECVRVHFDDNLPSDRYDEIDPWGERPALHQRLRNLGEYSTDDYFDFIFVLCAEEVYRPVLREMGTQLGVRANIVLPIGAGTHAPETIIENPRPIGVTLLPKAGSNLLRPMMRGLMKVCERREMPTDFFDGKDSLITSLWRNRDGTADGNHWNAPTRDYVDEAAWWYFRNTGLYCWNHLHESVTTRVFADLTDMAIVHLVRDPRDVITSDFSQSWGAQRAGMSEARIVELQMKYVTGFRYKAKSYDFMNWPPIRKMAQDFVDADRYAHMRSVRFEDLRAHPAETLKDLLRWLRIVPNPFVQITDSQIEEIVAASSFTRQTRGKRTEEENHVSTEWVRGRQFSFRRGAKGDWRTTLHPEVVEAIKEEAGELIVALGYETDMNWCGPARATSQE